MNIISRGSGVKSLHYSPSSVVDLGGGGGGSTTTIDDEEKKKRPKLGMMFTSNKAFYRLVLPLVIFFLVGFKLGDVILMNRDHHHHHHVDDIHRLSTPSSSIEGEDVTTIATTTAESTTKTKSCNEILDKLDIIYNERRLPRQAKSNINWTGVRLFDLYEPEATCFSEERFGSESNVRFDAYGDGPKFVCGVDYIANKATTTASVVGSSTSTTTPSSEDEVSSTPTTATTAATNNNKNCLIYSVGSNNDIRFEKAVQAHMSNCEVHTFDPTIEDGDFIGAEYATFHSWGLGTDGGSEGRTMHNRKNVGSRKSFESIIKELGHENRTIDILKVSVPNNMCRRERTAALRNIFLVIIYAYITNN